MRNRFVMVTRCTGRSSKSPQRQQVGASIGSGLRLVSPVCGCGHRDPGSPVGWRPLHARRSTPHRTDHRPKPAPYPIPDGSRLDPREMARSNASSFLGNRRNSLASPRSQVCLPLVNRRDVGRNDRQIVLLRCAHYMNAPFFSSTKKETTVAARIFGIVFNEFGGRRFPGRYRLSTAGARSPMEPPSASSLWASVAARACASVGTGVSYW